jgi:glycosyltransferase involved in cell wall biosynthesis
MSRIIVSIYVHPEFYPPTLNAIINLSSIYDEVVVLTRNNIETNFPFPVNVKIKSLGKRIGVIESEQSSLITKILFFLQFAIAHIPYLVNKKNRFVCYDAIPLLTISILTRFFRLDRHIWYHNHDMPNLSGCHKFSISWFAARYEKWSIKYISKFSLPSVDRLKYYPELDRESIEFVFLPNYPSIKIFNQYVRKMTPVNIRVLYQGSVAKLRGFEEFAKFMQNSEKLINLTLKGPVRNNYDTELNQLFRKLKVIDRIEFIGISKYISLVNDMTNYDVGLAVQLGQDEIRKTLGTASNKIYEYAASGMPVIVADNQQFKKYLKDEEWVFFYDEKADNFEDIITEIISNYTELSSKARIAFETKFNFEKYFYRDEKY